MGEGRCAVDGLVRGVHGQGGGSADGERDIRLTGRGVGYTWTRHGVQSEMHPVEGRVHDSRLMALTPSAPSARVPSTCALRTQPLPPPTPSASAPTAAPPRMHYAVLCNDNKPQTPNPKPSCEHYFPQAFSCKKPRNHSP